MPDRSLPDDHRPGGRQPHRDLRLVALVGAGGAVGTLLRHAVGLTLPSAPVPVATLAVNVSGALLLGVLTAALARRGPDTGPRRATRLALGTGVLGGCTTYSTLAVDVVRLAADGRAGVAAAYAVVTLVAGLAAAAAGLALGAAASRPPRRPGVPDVTGVPGGPS
ncbi:fluoride efflux transporter FluC [Cellulomonas marina]|uniref:Fluoride-specific ion channel FluC n=1 Tax=Cellulomonas marina TaxID=988821 RepID=A0A1I0ZBN4_9CELL|nr:CrcB family protein [Cellulomonas marina]GIG30751.1 hypothetical protein Cma02nite_33510 [Cellulomonas marina]SFB23169.1 CrcB protein [Cellulomonas marina]